MDILFVDNGRQDEIETFYEVRKKLYLFKNLNFYIGHKDMLVHIAVLAIDECRYLLFGHLD